MGYHEPQHYCQAQADQFLPDPPLTYTGWPTIVHFNEVQPWTLFDYGQIISWTHIHLIVITSIENCGYDNYPTQG